MRPPNAKPAWLLILVKGDREESIPFFTPFEAEAAARAGRYPRWRVEVDGVVVASAETT